VTASTVSASTVKLTGPGGVAVPATVGYSAAGKTFTLTPTARRPRPPWTVPGSASAR